MDLVRKRKMRSGNGEVGRHPFSQDVRYERKARIKKNLPYLVKISMGKKGKDYVCKMIILFYKHNLFLSYERLKLESSEGFEIPLVIRSSFLSYPTTMNIKIISQNPSTLVIPSIFLS